MIDTPKAFLSRRITKRGRRYYLGLDRVWVQDSGGSLGNYTMAEYDREIYTGLDYVSGTINCGFGYDKREVRIKVAHPAFREDGSVAYSRSLEDGSPHIAHRVNIPDGFMERVDNYSKRVYEPHSLYSAVRERLSSQAPISQGEQ